MEDDAHDVYYLLVAAEICPLCVGRTVLSQRINDL
jgi:hypothetical protein